MGLINFQKLKEQYQAGTQTHRSSAFGRRILDLSEAFHMGLLTDEILEFFVEEVLDRCEEQIKKFEEFSKDPECASECQAVVAVMTAFGELADRFDQMEHSAVVCEVAELERHLMEASAASTGFVIAA